MKHPATQRLFAYWNGLRGERTAPERAEIDPAAIREVLADSFMLDVDLDERFPFRLAGTRINGLVGTEQKGCSFLDLWREEERRNVAAILCTVADGACPVVAGGIASPDGINECAVELLVLPLRHHGKTHARILGLLKLLTQPMWLGLLPLGPISLRSLRIIDADELAAQRYLEQVAVGHDLTGPAAAVTGPAAAVAGPSTAALAVGPSRPVLRVIQGGR